ncbi:MAG: DUF5615 family PIN-like protein [Planctomycetia bacterium]|nr:DUF5615 family PIN-like protein [Planctomycetia bacterium]
MVRLLSDENFNGRIVRGLFHQRPGIDLVRVQDVGLSGVDDLAVLEWAAQNDRIVLTHDRNTMVGFAFNRVVAGQPMPGLFMVDDLAAIGQIINDLLLIDDTTEHAEWANRVEYLPL